MATTTTTVTALRCDYCERPEQVSGFVQSYRMIPTRRYRDKPFVPKGARDVDLCAQCVTLLSREHVNLTTPPKVRRCQAKREGIQCMLDQGHKSEHVASSAAHWGWLAA